MVAIALLAASMQSVPTATDDLRQKLDGYGKEHFSGMVAILKGENVVFFHAVGYADPETKRPFTRNSPVEIGSIVKPFIRVAYLKLAEKGKLRLDDSIGKYFANVPEDKKSITLDHLLRHQAGFQDMFGRDYEPMKRDELMEKMLKSKLLFRPGERDEYSNAGYSMLATILEKVTGKPIDEYMGEVQFDPLGMKRTGYLRSGWKNAEMPIGYDRHGKRWGTPRDHFWYPDGPSWNLRGNGGMLSTVTDLGKWANGVFDGKFVSDEIRLQLAPALFQKDAPPTKVWTAAGGNGIFNTVLAYSRSLNATIIAFSTDGRKEVESFLWDLAPLMLKIAREAR